MDLKYQKPERPKLEAPKPLNPEDLWPDTLKPGSPSPETPKKGSIWSNASSLRMLSQDRAALKLEALCLKPQDLSHATGAQDLEGFSIYML